MLIPLGQRVASGSLVDLLCECHGRIRRYLVLARHLAVAAGAPTTEIVEAAAQIRRYFDEGFPLHVADEEVDIAPRLSAICPEAVLQMSSDHRAHLASVAALARVCGDIERDADVRQHGHRLTAVLDAVTLQLEAHLEMEERLVFPAVRRLPRGDQDTIVAAMRLRRERALGMRS